MDNRETGLGTLFNDLSGLYFREMSAWELAEHLVKLGYTHSTEPLMGKLWQAIKDAREGEPLDLTGEQFELFSAIQNQAIGSQPESERKIHNPVTGSDYPVKQRTKGRKVKPLWTEPSEDDVSEEKTEFKMAEQVVERIKQAGYTRQLDSKKTPNWCKSNYCNHPANFNLDIVEPDQCCECDNRQPEPDEKSVEEIAKLLYFKAGGDGWEKEPDKPKHYLDLGKETFRKTAREILKLSVPELTAILDHKPKELIKGYPKCCEESWQLGYYIGHEDGCIQQLDHDQLEG